MLLGDDFNAVLADDYQARLQQLAASASPDVDRHILCHLFHSDQAVPAFTVGPVRFLPRAEWLDSFVKDSEIHELWCRALKRPSSYLHVGQKLGRSGLMGGWLLQSANRPGCGSIRPRSCRKPMEAPDVTRADNMPFEEWHITQRRECGRDCKHC